MNRLPLLRLLIYAKPYQTRIWSAIANSILSTIFDLAPPYLIGIAIDVVVSEENSLIARFGITSITGQLAILSLLTLLIWSLESLTEYLYSRLWRNLAQTLQHELRVDAYSHLQELELGYFEERSTGMLLSILNDDINQLERFLNFGAHNILHFLTTVLFVGSTFIALAPGVSWWAMLPIPFVIWGSVVFQAKLEPRYADVREKSGLISSRLTNNLSGIATIKSFTAEIYERDRVTDESEAYRRSNYRAIALSAAFVPLIRVVILVGFTATLFLGGLAVVNGNLSAGTYGFLVFIIQRLLWPFTDLSELMDEYQRAMASVRRVMGLLNTPIMIPHGDRPLPLNSVRGSVQFDDITFAYSGRNPVLNHLSLHMTAGATIGIVGATGSGKSTLVKLLLRFYEVQSGRILIDSIDIRELNLFDLRQCIGWVSQDVFLFHGTVAENIRYGSFDATREQIIQAAKLAEAHEFIEQLPQGYDTIVGERGQKLSGGQRQRLAIARAILKDPPILILDEATSAVDNETEAAIQLEYNLVERTVERDLLPMAEDLNLSILDWSPLGGGVLTGKYLHQDSDQDRLNKAEYFQHYKIDRAMQIAQTVVDIANEICSAAQVALAWIQQQSPRHIPIIGARTLEHLKDNLGCLQVALSEEQLIRLNAASDVDPGFALKFLRRLQNLFLGAASETLDLGLHPVSRLVLDRK